jgi:hypothetical protein
MEKSLDEISNSFQVARHCNPNHVARNAEKIRWVTPCKSYCDGQFVLSLALCCASLSPPQCSMALLLGQRRQKSKLLLRLLHQRSVNHQATLSLSFSAPMVLASHISWHVMRCLQHRAKSKD